MGQKQLNDNTPVGAHHYNPDKSYDDTRSGKQGTNNCAFWGDIAGRFCDPRECLASYLALETAEVIARVKPANLVSIPNRTHSCGSNPYSYWKKWGREITEAAQLEAYTLKDRGNSVLVLLYRAESLSELLATPPVRAMLRRAGYSGQMGISELLGILAQRMDSGIFPHEIGIFIGYPLKDVAGFMGLARIPFTCQGPWKMYGDPRASLRLAETFRWCRKQMAKDLANCSSPFECFAYGRATDAFFCQANGNDYQMHNARRQRLPLTPLQGGNGFNAAKERHQYSRG